MVRSFEIGTRAATVATRAYQQTIPVAVQLIDDFEDQNLAEYVGDTGQVAITNNQVFNGSWAAEWTNTTDNNVQIRSAPGDGLDNYPSKGQEFHYHIRFNTRNFTDSPEFWQPEWYRGDATEFPNRIQMRWQQTEVEVVLLGPDVANAILTRGGDPSTLSVDTWYRVEMLWDNAAGDLTGTGHLMQQTVVDPATDTQQWQFSTTVDNANINTNSAILFATEEYDDAGESFWCDYAYIERTA